jgi:chromate transporter
MMTESRSAAARPENDETKGRRLRELALLFIKLGTVAFGGPAAHIAMMEDEVVRRRGWLTREQFLDLLGATNLIPGPNSTEMAIHVGKVRAGWPGLLVAGVSFIVPAMVIVLAITWAYTRYGSLTLAIGVLYGVKPVVIAVVAQAIWGLGRSAVKTRLLAVIGVAALALVAFGVNELLVLFGTGAVLLLLHLGAGRGKRAIALVGLVAPPATGAAGAAAAVPFGLWPLFLVFLKIGSVLYGSGYVLLAFLRADLVEHRGWLTEAQLLDAVAIGQVTPGPVFTTATFIGYVLAGVPGALVATAAIFLPAFVFVGLTGPLVEKARTSPLAGAVLDGVNVASLALMTFVTGQLVVAAVVDALTLALALASAVLLIRCRVNSAWLVAGGALVGLVVAAIRGAP